MLKMGSVNISATSRISDADVAYFSASFSFDRDGGYSISKNVANSSVYNSNQAAVDADYAEFEEKAKELFANMQENNQEDNNE